MTNTNPAALDSEELLHIAYNAIARNDHETAITTLKRCVVADPENARAMYLLGAEYAQIGMYARAAATIEQALALDPTMHTASFHLGMLKMLLGEVEQIHAAWSRLDVLDHEHPIYLFKTAMTLMMEERLEEARECLTRGIANNQENPSLSRDMVQVLGRIDAEISKKAQQAAQEGDVGADHQKIMSAYAPSDPV